MSENNTAKIKFSFPEGEVEIEGSEDFLSRYEDSVNGLLQILIDRLMDDVSNNQSV